MAAVTRLLLIVALLGGLAGLAAGAWPRPVPLAREGPPPTLATWPVTPPGCCPASRWLADSTRVVLYHRPAEGPAGAWTTDLAGQMRPLWPRFGHLSADETLIVGPADGGGARAERLDGLLDRTVPTDGGEALPSPDGRQVAYLARRRPGGRTADSLERVTVAALDGSGPRGLLDLARADHLRWFPDGRRLLAFGWRPDGTAPGLWVVDTLTGGSGQIVAANFLTGIDIAPDGQWVAYLATMQPGAGESGLWIARTDGSERRRLPVERAARWAPDGQALLAIVPAPGGKELHRIDPATGAVGVLVGRAHADFDVEADDWAVAPDGRHLLYRSARDRALWLLALPASATP